MRTAPFIVVFCALLLIVMACQYPLSTTFPIGGDAASYIRKTLEREPFWQSRYPTAQLILTSSYILPLSWPDRFVWVMAAGHIATGFALAWLLWCLTRQPLAVAAALFFWALSTTGLQHHFEDATLAQLWSLPWLLLWLASVISRRWPSSILWLLLAITTHPFSGLMAVLIALLILTLYPWHTTIPQPEKRFIRVFAAITFVLGLAAAVVLLMRPNLLSVVRDNQDIILLGEAVRSPHGAIILLAPLGFLYLMHKKKMDFVARATLVAWLVTTIFLAFNDRWHLFTATNRFSTYYFILLTTLAAGATTPIIRRALPLSLLRIPATLLSAAAMVLWVWSGNAAIYRYYESPSRYARLHRDEQTAFAELAHRLPAHSRLTSSEANRHAEWLPILTERAWSATTDTEPVWHGDASAWQEYARQRHITHLVTLNHTEEPPPPMRSADNPFPIVFENEAVIVYQLL